VSHLRRRAASRRHGRFDDANDACFIVRDHNGHALAYVYFENEAGQRTAANLLTQRRSAAPEVNDPIIVVYGAETPPRSRDITRLFFCPEEPSVGQSRCRFDAQKASDSMPHVVTPSFGLPRLSGRRSYDD
jgi:hypothetical protein